MLSYIRMMAKYNRWCNRRLYDATENCPAEEYRRDHGAFFRSLHGTLNHLLVADRIWMARFTGSADAPAALDAILFDDLGALREAREAEDERIEAYADSLDEGALHRNFTYRTISNPATVSQPLAPALVHFFNHQTHHRGQAHCLLTRISGSAPSFDLIQFQREAGFVHLQDGAH